MIDAISRIFFFISFLPSDFSSTIYLDHNNPENNIKDPLKNRKENDLIDNSLLLHFDEKEEVKDE